MRARKDLIGHRFGRLIVTGGAEDYISKAGKHYARWQCKCDCGTSPVYVTGSNLRSGHVKSCGCFNREVASTSHKKYNNYKLNLSDENGLYGIGYCTNTGSEFYFDMDDYDKIKHGNWIECRANANYYVVQTWDANSKSTVRLHWLVVGKYFDHADRNTFNNRKYNLRKASQLENMQNCSIRSTNRSGFTGIHWLESKKRWLAFISINKQRKHLGVYKDKDDAIKARLTAEAKYYKEFAPQRHLFAEYNILEDDLIERTEEEKEV